MKTKKKVWKESASEPPDAPMGTADGATSAGWHHIEAAFRCLKEFQYAKVRGISSPQHETPDAFAIGQLLHVGKGRWFSKRFKSDEQTLESIRDEMLEYATRSKLPMSTKAQREALRYFTEYVEHWRVRARPDVLAAEYDLGPAPLQKGDGPGLHRTARLDDVSRYPEAGGALCIGESKTTSTSVPDCVNQYTLHGQPLLQAALWRLAPQGEAMHGPVAGVMLDVIVKGYGGKRSTFARMMLPITERAVTWYIKNMRATLTAVGNIDWNTDVPRNISACTRMVGRARIACPFRDLCLHGRSATARFVMGEKAESLLTWKPTDERRVPPWE